MKPAIVVEEITRSFGETRALAGVSFTVAPGSILGLLGPNGAGKTTLVRILTTLLRADSGRAQVGGYDIAHHAAQVRHIIGLAGQYAAVDEYLTGRENLEMVGQLYHVSRREARQRAQAILERFHLTTAASRPVRTYSGGMRRRLDLGATLVAKPQIVFLDEPTTGLDPRTRQDMWQLIRELAGEGVTILLTTQYLEEADELSDTIVVIDEGKVVASGTAEALKAQVGADVVEIEFISSPDVTAAAPLLHSLALDPQHFSVNEEQHHISVLTQGGAQALMSALRILDQHHLVPKDVKLRRPSLDDVFLSLTGHTHED